MQRWMPKEERKGCRGPQIGHLAWVSKWRDKFAHDTGVDTRSSAVGGSRGDGGIGRRWSGRNLYESSRRWAQDVAWLSATEQLLRTAAHCGRHCAIGDIVSSTVLGTIFFFFLTQLHLPTLSALDACLPEAERSKVTCCPCELHSCHFVPLSALINLPSSNQLSHLVVRSPIVCLFAFASSRRPELCIKLTSTPYISFFSREAGHHGVLSC